MKKILDVGQCDFDHGKISQVICQNFDVEVQRASSLGEASQLAQQTKFDLILVNRILDADGSPGMDVLASLKSEASTSEIPVMVISNFAEAQENAVAAGAVQGFGKTALSEPETVAALQKYLQ